MPIICKTGGAIFIMAAAGGLGESKARRLGQRVKELESFQQSLKLLSAEVVYDHCLLTRAFRRISGQGISPVKDIYEKAAEMLESGRDISARQAWEGALKEVSSSTCYKERDLEVIETLGISLGENRKEGQLTQIELVLKRLEFVLQEAREDQSRNERMWRYLGLLGGAALVILLL